MSDTTQAHEAARAALAQELAQAAPDVDAVNRATHALLEARRMMFPRGSRAADPLAARRESEQLWLQAQSRAGGATADAILEHGRLVLALGAPRPNRP